MTTMKKLASLILAVMMLLSVCAVANADETAKVSTIEGHTYTAYQIFTGTQAVENDKKLGNVAWGTGINGDAFLLALKAENTFVKDGINAFADCTDAQSVADVLATFNDNSDEAKKFARLALANKGTGTEVTDKGASLAVGYYLFEDTTANLDEASAYNALLLQVSKDVEIQDKTSVPQVEKKVDDKNDSNTSEDETSWQDSADYDIGDNVPFQLTATLGNNLDNFETYKVEFVDTLSAGLTYNEDAKIFVNGTEITEGFTVEANGQSLTITIADAIASGAKSESKIVVQYTAKLNENAVVGSAGNPNEVYLSFSNNPVKDTMGKTPVDKVIVFTYKTIVNKVDESGAELAGAGFTLYKKNAAGQYEVVGTIEAATDKTSFEWKGLDDGDYKLEETTVPAGYNKAADIEFTISATHDVTADEPTLLTLTAGDKITGNVEAGSVTATVQNKTGATLPETGGIGTTIFYAVGGLLVVLAVVMLVTKRRVGEEN